MSWLRPAASCALAAVFLVTAPNAAQALTFTVNSTDDAPDANLDGTCAAASVAGPCTLRAAIQEANFNDSNQDDILVPAGTYNLDVGPAGNDNGASGDLDITDGDDIVGVDGARATVIVQTLPDRVFDARISNDNNQGLVIEGVTITGGDLGGIRVLFGGGQTALTLRNSAVTGNTGDGITADSGGSPVLTLDGSTVSGNTGRGISIGDGEAASITNSTISGNGGGGLLTAAALSGGASATLTNTTVASNTGVGLDQDASTTITLDRTIVSGNSGGSCSAAINSLGYNIDSGSTCGLNDVGDQSNTDPLLGALANNGGETNTHALGDGSPAIDTVDAAVCPPPATDQRGVTRPEGEACDIGAYEFVPSKTVPSVPDCSPTAAITLTMDPPAGETPVAFKFKIDDGPTQTASTSDETATINLPGEGSFKLEYWSQTSAGEEPPENHLVDTAVVDQTDPTLAVSSDQNQSLYVIKRNATVTVQANDALSGLTIDPTAESERVTTDARGEKTVEWTAVDLCDNRTTQQLTYTVLGPGLGERAVIEPLGDGVEVQLPETGAARASQKGEDFEPVTQPREIPIGTTIDASEGGARITSSKSATEGDIKDGTFEAGVFQVLESRNQTENALTKLKLRGGSFNNCEAGKGASAARLSRRAIRRLRGSATGRFRTRGRHSAATVRGTDWEVIDRCDGTLTKVERGEVAVRDFRLRKTILVKEGKRYLARAEPPDPVLGETVNVDVVKGKVFVKLPRKGEFARASQKGTDFVPLTSERSIPVRSILDTRKGTVALRSAQNRKGRIQSGKFSDGVFQVLQTRKRREKGLTTLRMKGSAARFKRCGKGSSATAAPDAHASLTRRQIRRLRARARGRYRTRSRYSAATVRGTVWTATDSCAGTLTAVKRGKVAVRDFRRKKTIVVTAGKRYFAKAKP